MFKYLLAAGDGFMTITHDPVKERFTARVDRAKISSHGRPALADLLLRLHIYRCTADVEACRTFYEELTHPGEQFLEWRRIVLAHQPPKQIFVQSNTFVEDGKVVLKYYEASVRGVIQSWADRASFI